MNTLPPSDSQDTPDQLWDLLTHGSRPEVPPDFQARVMAEVRQTPQDTFTLATAATPAKVVPFPLASPRWFWRVASVAAAVVVGSSMWSHFSNRPGMLASSNVVTAVSEALNDDASLEQELTAVQDIHALLAVEDPRELSDDQLVMFLN